MSTTTPKFRQPLRRRVEVVKQMLRAGQLAAKLQILRQDRSRLREISEGVHIQQMDKVTEDLRRALVQFLVMQLRAVAANLMRMRQMQLGQKSCGAGAPGSPGFQSGNTCAGEGGSGSSSGDMGEFIREIEPADIEYWTGENNGHKPMADDIKDDESFIDAVKELLPGWDGSIDEAQQVVMGLAGVLDGSHVSLSRGRDNDGRMVTHVHFSSRTPDGKNFAFIGERRLYRDGDDLLIYNEEFNVHPDMQRQGIGLQMLATQTAFAQKHGVTEIETYADGEGRRYEEGKKAGMNPPSGYMAWPNLGYDAPLEAGARSKIRAMSSAPASVKKASTVSEVIATDEGRAWWEKHGTGQIMAFDPTKGSRSTRVLVKVLARKGITGAKTSTSTKTFSQPFGMRSEKRMPPGSRPITTAEGLSRSVFDPREWDKKLIETLMVPYAGAYLTAASSEIEIAKIAADRKSVDISRSKMIADYDRWKAFCPTGIGNGIDNSCPPKRGSSASQAVKDWAASEFGDALAPDGAKKADNFIKWFGESVVTNEKGEPKVVFHHGSFDEDTDTLEIAEGGMHFGTEEAARQRAYGKLDDDLMTNLEVYQNEDGSWGWESGHDEAFDTFESEDAARSDAEDTFAGMQQGYDMAPEDLGTLSKVYLAIKNPMVVADQKADWTAAIAKAKARGHDGIVCRNEFENKGSLSYIVFEPSQVKSVKNDGSYSASVDLKKTTKASTASQFLRQQKEIQLEEMVVVTPLGEFRFNISTEYPKWMKRRLRELLEETFAQDYWKQINDTTSADITDILQRGIRDGWSIDDMADKIAEGLPDDSDYAKDRATAIARTECFVGGTTVDGANVLAAHKRWYSGEVFEIVTKAGRKFTATPNHPMLTARGWVAVGDLMESDDLICHSGYVQDSSAPRNVNKEKPPVTIDKIFDSLSAVGVVERRACRQPDFHGDGVDGYVDVSSTDSPLSFGGVAPLNKSVIDIYLSKSSVGQSRLATNGTGSDSTVMNKTCALSCASKAASVPFDDAADADRIDIECLGDLREGLALPVEIDDGVCRRPKTLGVGSVPSGQQQSSGCLVTSDDASTPGGALHSALFTSENIGNLNRTETRSVQSNGAVSKVGVLNRLAITEGSPRNAEVLACIPDNISTTPETLGCLAHADAGLIEFDRFLIKRKVWFSGHVFNLSTMEGHYIVAGGLYTSNCGHALNGARSAAIDDLAEELAPYGLPLKKSWMSVLGSTTRETHADADGVPADIEGMWTIGGFRCRWPGDTMLPAYERVNCMCTILSEYGLTDAEANELIADYNARVQEREQYYRSQGKSYADLKSCGAGKPGDPGFEENNTCAGGGGSAPGSGGSGSETEWPASSNSDAADNDEQTQESDDQPASPPSPYGVALDADAPTTFVEDKDGNKIAVVDRSDASGHKYLDEVEADAEAKGLAVDFETVEEMQDDAGLDEDSGAFQAYVGSAYKAFTDEDGDIPSGIEDEIDTYGYNHGAIDSDYASSLIEERMSEAESEWANMDHASEIDGWEDMLSSEQEDAYSEWIDAKRAEIESDIEDQRHEARQEAVRGMRQELESGTASSTLACCAQLYRGLSLSEDRLQEMIEEGEVVHSGVNSWTTSRSTAKNFTANGGNSSRRQVILVVRSPKAGFINKANTLDEKEVIRPPSSMKIKQVVKTRTMVFLYVDEDPDYVE